MCQLGLALNFPGYFNSFFLNCFGFSVVAVFYAILAAQHRWAEAGIRPTSDLYRRYCELSRWPTSSLGWGKEIKFPHFKPKEGSQEPSLQMLLKTFWITKGLTWPTIG